MGGSRRTLSVFVAWAISIALCAACAASAAGFPEVDRSKLLITLVRSACYGSCPDYRVTIDGAGQVVFSSEGPPPNAVSGLYRQFSLAQGLVLPGEHRDRVTASAVDALVKQFRDARFFALREGYQAQITDQPTYLVAIRTGHGDKYVIDYAGERVGMPKAVTEIEDAIDRVAGTSRWVAGADGLVDWLARDGFDFHSRQAALLALAGVDQADERTLVQLVGRGAPLDLKSPLPGARPIGADLLEGASRAGRADLFRTLVAQGWLKQLGRDRAGAAFAGRAAGCNPQFVDAFVDAGLGVDAVNRDAEVEQAAGGTALSALATSYACNDESARRATAGRLLARGADPNHRDREGKTPIFGVEDIGLLNLLLAHGADAKLTDKKGASAVFSSWTDDIVLRLLQAGAGSEGRYYDGLTLREQMKERPMPQVERWLAHRTDAGERRE